MKIILVLSITSINNIDDNGIYPSLYKQLSINNKVDVLSINNNPNDILILNDNLTVYTVKSKSLFNVGKIRKALSLLSLNKRFKKVLKKHLKTNKYDLVLYSTPPITLNKTIKYVKKKYKVKSYLLLKDIFPQNAVDLGMFSKKGIIFKYFRRKEKNLYNTSDYIGCMSRGNKEYLLSHNKISEHKVEVNPNSISVENLSKDNTNDKSVLSEFGIDSNKTVFLYGGNLGKPQGIDFLIDVIDFNETSDDKHIIIIGSGTDKHRIDDHIKNNKIINTTVLNSVPKVDYNKLVKACDVGLIFLDNKFTIPNIPSRMLNYLEFSKPILAATDINTDLKEIIENGSFGYWCESTDVKVFYSYMEKLTERNNRNEKGINGHKYLIENYDVKFTVNKIINKII